MFPLQTPAHRDQANQISGHLTITKEWSDVWGKPLSLQAGQLRILHLGEWTKTQKGTKEERKRKSSVFQTLGTNTTTNMRADMEANQRHKCKSFEPQQNKHFN